MTTPTPSAALEKARDALFNSGSMLTNLMTLFESQFAADALLALSKVINANAAACVDIDSTLAAAPVQAAQEAVPGEAPKRSILLTGAQVRDVLEFVAPDVGDADQLESEVIVEWCEARTSAEGEAMPAGWTVVAPDGRRWTGTSAHNAANMPNRTLAEERTPEEKAAAADALAALTVKHDAEEAAMYEHLNCPACGGSGHVDDAKDRAARAAPETPPPLPLRAFEEWLNDHRGANVSEVFHDVVAHYRAALAAASREDAAMLDWLDKNGTFFDVQADQPTNGPNVPVLASVSKRIWYHATNDQQSYPFSEAIRAAMAAGATKGLQAKPEST